MDNEIVLILYIIYYRYRYLSSYIITLTNQTLKLEFEYQRYIKLLHYLTQVAGYR